MTDEIIQEVWRAKERIAEQFNYDIDALAAAFGNDRRNLDERSST